MPHSTIFKCSDANSFILVIKVQRALHLLICCSGVCGEIKMKVFDRENVLGQDIE